MAVVNHKLSPLFLRRLIDARSEAISEPTFRTLEVNGRVGQREIKGYNVYNQKVEVGIFEDVR